MEGYSWSWDEVSRLELDFRVQRQFSSFVCCVTLLQHPSFCFLSVILDLPHRIVMRTRCFTNCWEHSSEQAGWVEGDASFSGCHSHFWARWWCMFAPRRGSPHALDPPPIHLVAQRLFFPSSLSIAPQRREEKKGSPLNLPLSRFITSVRTRDVAAPQGDSWGLCGNVCVRVAGVTEASFTVPSAPL